MQPFLPQTLAPLTCRQVRDVDRIAVSHFGMCSLVLMESAARAVAAETIAMTDGGPGGVAILCGVGNNGGDGYAAARLLANAGLQVRLIAADEPRTDDARVNANIAALMGLQPLHAADATVEQTIRDAGVIIDGLLGTGSSGPPREPLARLIRLANAAAGRRLAIDAPTGLDSDSGDVADPCFRADVTVTFVAAKVGFDAAAAKSVLGRVVVADIGVPLAAIDMAR
jgi:NAD(P)H-hydrate epimerase